MKALCFGSLNIDYTYQVDHFITGGESMASTEMQTFPGGKGLNQAIALARCGVDTWMAGAIGSDGRFLMDILSEAGVHTEQLMLLKERPTGHALIQRLANGENAILLYSGANRCITAEMIERVLESYGAGDLLLVQNEINMVPEIVAQAHERGMTVALNASPVDDSIRQIPSEQINVLLTNTIEAYQLLGMPSDTDRETVLNGLMERYPETLVVMTAGKDGAYVLQHGRLYQQDACPVTPVDTSGAGDTFAGFFLGTQLQGGTMAEALQRGIRASAICVTREGTSPSIPSASEVDTWIASQAENEEGKTTAQ